jgi:hypothetical protein
MDQEVKFPVGPSYNKLFPKSLEAISLLYKIAPCSGQRSPGWRCGGGHLNLSRQGSRSGLRGLFKYCTVLTTKNSQTEYRAVSGVFQTINPPPPLHPASVSSPRTKGGGTNSPGGERWGGQYFGRRQTMEWPLTV